MAKNRFFNDVVDAVAMVAALRAGFDPTQAPRRRSMIGWGVVADPDDHPGSWAPVGPDGQAIPIVYLDGNDGTYPYRIAAWVGKKFFRASWENAHWACYNYARYLGENPEEIPLFAVAPEFTRLKAKKFADLAVEFIPPED